MAYEVIKQRGKRAYRYTVEYYHDEAGKGRTRWHYQGPVEAGAQTLSDATAPNKDRVSTASRLLDALERLLVRGEYADVTASAIALEAQVAHGTFYRHFKDKRDALRAAMQRLSERAEHLAHLDDPTPSRDRERQRVRDWVRQKLMTVSEQPGVWRAWSALSESDAAIAAVRKTLRESYREMVQRYLDQLRNLGLTDLHDGQGLTRTILALIYGVLQDSYMYNEAAPSAAIIDQACLMVDRAIFAPELGPIPDPPAEVSMNEEP